MTRAAHPWSFSAALAAAVLTACSGSSSDGGGSPTLSLAVTDAASEQLSTFTIGLESVELVSADNQRVELLPQPLAVDFLALGELSRVLNITAVAGGVFTRVEVVLLFDGHRVHVAGESTPAMLVDSEENVLDSGTRTLPIEFPVPLQVTSGNYVIELDLDLGQSVDVAGPTKVYFEPALLARINRDDPGEHAVGGNLRTVVLDRSLFRIALEAPIGAEPVVEVQVGPGTVFQIDGACLLGAAGLAQLDTLAPGTWVQAFGSLTAGSSRFQAATVEAGTGSFNGGTDIVEGVIIDRAGGAGTDTVLTVVGHSSDATHTSLQFNLTYQVNTSHANTKVVRRGSAALFDADDLNVGQRVRMFGALTLGGPNVLDVTTPTDVVRMEPTWIFGTYVSQPPSELSINLSRVDRLDVGTTSFDWSASGTNAPDPTKLRLDDSNNLTGGQGIFDRMPPIPIVARGFFTPVDDDGPDFEPDVIANRERLPSLLLVRDRTNTLGTELTVVPSFPSTSRIELAFSGTPAGMERAVIDMGFAGEIDVRGTGIALVPNGGLGFGLYLLFDRTLNTVELHLTFSAFSSALQAKLTSGASLFNVGAVGVYNAITAEVPTALVGVTVQ